jgi:hypothetical protein
MYIAYDIKNGVEYAKLYTSKRYGTETSKDYVNLGRVLDKEAGIYKNREKGIFTYTLDGNIYGKAPASFVPVINNHTREKLNLDFGDTFLLNNFIDGSGLVPAIEAIGYANMDTLKSMICYYILCSTSNCHANDWWDGNYARILFPNADLTSQRISDFLSDIGEEEAIRGYFAKYLPLIGGSKDGENILIDSTGLPNSIRFPLTAVSNHNGDISNEVRLIYVTQQETGLPIYFRYCPGNVGDVSTLIRSVRELKALGVKTKLAVLDAGYYSDANFKELYDMKIAFVTRMKENLKLYKNLLETNKAELENKDNIVGYNGRYVYMKCVECQIIQGRKAYAYVVLDIERKASESKKLFAKAKSEKLTDIDVHNRISKQGYFVLITSKRFNKTDILPMYYTRQQIEQVFDIGKNYANLIPLRVQTETTFRGHLLLTFISAVIIKKLQDHLKKSAYNPISLFLNLRNHKCKVFADRIITQEAFKKANECYKLFNIECPVEISR